VVVSASSSPPQADGSSATTMAITAMNAMEKF
jgi:hypothetical protein